MPLRNYEEQKLNFENNHDRNYVGVYCDVN